MPRILPTISSPADLKSLSFPQLTELAAEIREELCRLAEKRSIHFASNLGVVELCIALHTTFDFTKDRLVWDTGHQIYPHKLLTGRYEKFETLRTQGGLMGYPNPEESGFDLFLTGHAGCSVGSILGLACGDNLNHPEEKRHNIAVIGDGALASGVVFEALSHAGWLKKNVTVILNDNKMAISPRVGGLAHYLDSFRMNKTYLSVKNEIHRLLQKIPRLGKITEKLLGQFKLAVKAGLLGGAMFEELGFRYIGPIDGHNIRRLRKFLTMVRQYNEPVLLHIFTEKGHGFRPAEQDPTTYHATTPAIKINGRTAAKTVTLLSDSEEDTPKIPFSYTEMVRNALFRHMKDDRRICVITAAMCQGNMLEPIRDLFPDRFFDVGICESHALVFAAGLAKSGMKPVVDIYSTFMQRGYDQIFQEISLQNLPVTLLLDRAGIVGADGPTHHGVFDIAYLRPFPNLTVMAPGCAEDVEPMLSIALQHDFPAAIRYPKCTAVKISEDFPPLEPGKAQVLRSGKHGTLAACGGLLSNALTAASELAFDGFDVGVVNARFVKPLDNVTLLEPLRQGRFLVTLEEGVLAGGFGSAVLEAAVDEHLDTRKLYRLGIPDHYVEHGERNDLLADIGLDVIGIKKTVLKMKNG
ncbi:MAG: 1-deoxy-D-xylulose-5-phosphate synthase [Planctomycetaceae bacterium]|jgi:1-deoxy-D-xylulose-5-phosphate synthase|nr:1-deoxy-D-xylulose-5-phosphate synthase [Planctomycetaceae bacterium]